MIVLIKELTNYNSFRDSDSTGDKKVTVDDYNPAKSKYHPIDDACWKHGDK
jgi:hypothetical protein